MWKMFNISKYVWNIRWNGSSNFAFYFNLYLSKDTHKKALFEAIWQTCWHFSLSTFHFCKQHYTCFSRLCCICFTVNIRFSELVPSTGILNNDARCLQINNLLTHGYCMPRLIKTLQSFIPVDEYVSVSIIILVIFDFP